RTFQPGKRHNHDRQQQRHSEYQIRETLSNLERKLNPRDQPLPVEVAANLFVEAHQIEHREVRVNLGQRAPDSGLERQPPKQLERFIGINELRIAAERSTELAYFLRAGNYRGW